MSNLSRLNLLPIATTAIVCLTAVPVELRHAVWPNGLLRPPDIVANVLLYVPLGIALCRTSPRGMLLTALTLTVSIEFAQIWMFERFSSFSDIIANIAGAGLGYIGGRLAETRTSVWPDTVPLRRLFLPSLIAAPLIALATVPIESSSLSTWDLEHSLSFGNERTGDRPWIGTLYGLAVLPQALSKDDVRDAVDVRYVLEMGPTAAYALPAPLTLDGGPPALAPPGAARQIGEAALRANALTIVAEVATADVRQRGPARIVSYSFDTTHRNFDLGQEGRRLVFRIRTETTGPNANDWRTETPNVLEPERRYIVTATYDGAVARLFLNGELYGRSNLAAAGCGVPALCDAGMPFARAMLGASFALLVLGGLRPKVGSTVLGIALCCGAGSAFLEWWLQTLLASSVPNVWLGLLNVAGSLSVAIGVVGRPLRAQNG